MKYQVEKILLLLAGVLVAKTGAMNFEDRIINEEVESRIIKILGISGQLDAVCKDWAVANVDAKTGRIATEPPSAKPGFTPVYFELDAKFGQGQGNVTINRIMKQNNFEDVLRKEVLQWDKKCVKAFKGLGAVVKSYVSPTGSLEKVEIDICAAVEVSAATKLWAIARNTKAGKYICKKLSSNQEPAVTTGNGTPSQLTRTKGLDTDAKYVSSTSKNVKGTQSSKQNPPAAKDARSNDRPKDTAVQIPSSRIPVYSPGIPIGSQDRPYCPSRGQKIFWNDPVHL